MSKLQQMIETRINQAVEKAIGQALDTLLGGGESAAPTRTDLKSVMSEAASGAATQAVSSSVQELVDVGRRAIRYGKSNIAFNKKERNVARRVIKAVKRTHRVSRTGKSDVWAANGC
jgi:hypothetical protein